MKNPPLDLTELKRGLNATECKIEAIVAKADAEREGRLTGDDLKEIRQLESEVEEWRESIAARERQLGRNSDYQPRHTMTQPGAGDWTKQADRTPPPQSNPDMPLHLTGWVDTDGNGVPVLAKDMSFANIVRGANYSHTAAAKAEDVPFLLGHLICGKLTGRYADADIQAAVHSVGNDGTGGYMVPPIQSARVIDLARNKSVLFQAGAMTVPMPSSELIMIRVKTDPSAAWVGENSTIPASNGTFGRVTFRARKMGIIVKLSRELVEDAANAPQLIESQIQQAMALELDRVGLLGDGDGEEPVGIFSHADVQEIGSVASPVYDDWIDAVEDIELVNGIAASTIMPPSVKATLAKLKETESGAYLAPPSDYTALQRLVTNQLSASQAVVGDFSQVMIGIRSAINLEFSREANDSNGNAFTDDQLWIKATWRGDVQFAHANHLVKLTGIS